ncbi:DUF885 family protein [Flagellimonas hadalis]|uniref:DUF885 domain-containing protein n=1 Tax=Flagellimonas hadalis TaxID=2597517 RepID=A0A5N5IKJ0_9FLAO|nr:DUF885 family protein [Allomuricauda hadalis]KAB5484759.1 DUF885 domain-containing protein [Allomuricauda hadalis]
MRNKKIVWIASAILFMGSISMRLNAQAKQEALYVPCEEMPDLMTKYNADYGSLVRFYAPGARGFWGRTNDPGGSPERRARMTKLRNDYLAKLEKLDFNSLPQECKADYVLFKRDLEMENAEAKEQEVVYQKIKKWFPFSNNIYSYLELRRRGHQPDATKMAKEWNDVVVQLKTLKTQLEETTTLAKDEVEEALLVITDLKNSAENVYSFYNGYDPLFTWWMPTVYEEMDKSFDEYVKTFNNKVDKGKPVDESGIVGNPVGREELMKQLEYEMIDYTPEELIKLANEEFAWCDAELLKASQEMGFGNDWQAAQEKVKNAYVEPGKQPELILRLYTEAVDFLKKNDLITLPPLAEEVWGMGMMSPERQLVNPFFTGGSSISISYPTDAMTYEQRMMSMRGNNPHFSMATVHHELLAGHNLQGFMNSRHRTYRNFGTPFWTEGWALYWELLLWDKGFPQGPEDRIGMLFWHMHRCARIIFSLNYHLGKWTPQECIDFLVDRVGHERANAEGEVRRSFVGNYPPLYQLAYLTGGRQFYALHKELVDSGKMTNKEFHDRIITMNAMPVEMIKAIMTDQKISKNYKAKWKFYDPPKQ